MCGEIHSDQLNKGDEYDQLNPTIAINILTYDYLPYKEYHSQFVIMEKNRHYQLTDNMSIHFLELKKWTDLGTKAKNRLERWLLYLSNNNPAELEEVAKMDTTIQKAVKAEEVFSADKKTWYEYLMREKSERDYISGIKNAERRGLRQGRAEGKIEGLLEGEIKGKLEGKLETARNMLSKGLSHEMVQECTGLTAEEIRKAIEKTN